MKCVFTKRCQFRGIVPKGTVLDLTELERAIPNVKASIRPLDAQAGGRPDVKAPSAPPKGTGKTEPLTGADGAPLPPNAQMSDVELRRRLEAAGVRAAEGTSRQQMFVMLQEALQPDTGKG